MSRKADAAFGQIEAESEPHRAAQPGVGPAFRRPRALDKAAEYDPIVGGKSRFKQAQNANAQSGTQRSPHNLIGKGRGEKLDVVGRLDEQIGGCRAARELIERLGEPGAVRTRERRLNAVLS